MSGGYNSEIGRERECIEHFFIGYAEEILVGKKDLEGRGSIRDDLTKLRFSLGVVAGHGHVKRIVACAVALCFLLPYVVTLERVLIARRTDHLNECCGATDECGLARSGVRVLGKGGHEGQMNVNMRIDESGKDQLPGCIDDFGS